MSKPVEVMLYGYNRKVLDRMERDEQKPDADRSWIPGTRLMFDLEASDSYDLVLVQTLEHPWETVLIEQLDGLGNVKDDDGNSQLLYARFCSERKDLERMMRHGT